MWQTFTRRERVNLQRLFFQMCITFEWSLTQLWLSNTKWSLFATPKQLCGPNVTILTCCQTENVVSKIHGLTGLRMKAHALSTKKFQRRGLYDQDQEWTSLPLPFFCLWVFGRRACEAIVCLAWLYVHNTNSSGNPQEWRRQRPPLLFSKGIENGRRLLFLFGTHS